MQQYSSMSSDIKTRADCCIPCMSAHGSLTFHSGALDKAMSLLSLQCAVSQTEVDPEDPAFQKPTKFIGPEYRCVWIPSAANQSQLRERLYIPVSRHCEPAQVGVHADLARCRQALGHSSGGERV